MRFHNLRIVPRRVTSSWPKRRRSYAATNRSQQFNIVVVLSAGFPQAVVETTKIARSVVLSTTVVLTGLRLVKLTFMVVVVIEDREVLVYYHPAPSAGHQYQ